MFSNALEKDIPYIDRIVKGSFIHQGKAFTITYTFPSAAPHSGRHLREAKKNCRDLAKLLPGVCGAVKRDKSEGYVVSIHIPEHISTQYYSELFTNEGLPFTDRLLTNRHDKLLEICNSANLQNHSRFIVTCSGIYDDLDDPYHIRCYFKDFGMAPLENIAQCYGFALAVSSVLEKDIFKGKKYVLKYVSLEGFNSAISVMYDVVENNVPKALNKW